MTPTRDAMRLILPSMHRQTAGLAIASLLAGPAIAQSVTIYGIVDTGVEVVTNVGPTKSRVTRVPSLTGSLPSRLGFRGSEDLGDGYSAVFLLGTGLRAGHGYSQSGWTRVGPPVLRRAVDAVGNAVVRSPVFADLLLDHRRYHGAEHLYGESARHLSSERPLGQLDCLSRQFRTSHGGRNVLARTRRGSARAGGRLYWRICIGQQGLSRNVGCRAIRDLELGNGVVARPTGRRRRHGIAASIEFSIGHAHRAQRLRKVGAARLGAE